MPVQDELATIVAPSDERDAVDSLRARVQRVAEQIAAGDGSDTTHREPLASRRGSGTHRAAVLVDEYPVELGLVRVARPVPLAWTGLAGLGSRLPHTWAKG